MKLVKIALLAVLVTAVLAGCNTVSGAGQDIANTGHAISRAAS